MLAANPFQCCYHRSQWRAQITMNFIIIHEHPRNLIVVRRQIANVLMNKKKSQSQLQSKRNELILIPDFVFHNLCIDFKSTEPDSYFVLYFVAKIRSHTK